MVLVSLRDDGAEELVVHLGLGPALGVRGRQHVIHKSFRTADVQVRTGTGTGQHATDVQLLFGRAVVEVELNTRGVRRLLDASGEGGAISGAGRIVHFELAAQHREALGHT